MNSVPTGSLPRVAPLGWTRRRVHPGRGRLRKRLVAELRAALEHERRMRAAEVDAAERRGRVAAEATGQHRVLPGLLG